MQKKHSSANIVFIGIFLIAMGIVSVEVILTRIFSFSIWYHFAYLTINIALLGFGSSGAVLAAFSGILKNEKWRYVIFLSALLSAIFLIITFLLLSRFPLQPHIMFNQPIKFIISLLCYYICTSLPFFFAGTAIAGTIANFSLQVSYLYFWDLFGAAIGSLLSLFILNYIGAPGGVLLCAFFLLAGAVCFAVLFSKRMAIIVGIAALVLAIMIPSLKERIEIIPSGSKALAIIYKQPDTYKLLFTRWNAINRVDVYTNLKRNTLPFWASGVSSTYKGSFPPFYDMQYDAHNGSNIFQFNGREEDFNFLDYHILKTPYVILEKPNVLVIGVGGGIDVYNALRNHASKITAVELQPITVNLLKNELSDWTGNIYINNDRIALIAGEGRNFINSSKEQYDLIQITVTDTFAALNTGAYVLMESYLYTKEAIATYFDHITENGLICIIAGDHLLKGSGQYPPLTARLILQYLQVMRSKGIELPQRHIAIVGRWEENGNLHCVPLLKKTPFKDSDISKLQKFSDSMGFSLIYNPLTIHPNDNFLERIIVTPENKQDEVISQAPYNITPSTDDIPFFYNFCKWKTVYEVFNNTKFDFSTPVFGQAILVLLLLQSIIISFLFIMFPLIVTKTNFFSVSSSLGYLIYFCSIGIGFMFLEISFIQKFVLFLGYPAYAFAVTLFSLLLFSGLGSYLTKFVKNNPHVMVKKILLALVPTLLFYAILTDKIFSAFIGQPFLHKAIVTIIMQMPLGLLLGMFFPLGIKIINQIDTRIVPWAWGVNGMCSVVSSILAIIIAMSFGFRVVAYLAIGIYSIGCISLIITTHNFLQKRMYNF
ncbi:MAG: hypothetical protein N2171_01940 [Clostridia bacterium]|nr:hypothetical protein [Clostridia bacterium]